MNEDNSPKVKQLEEFSHEVQGFKEFIDGIDKVFDALRYLYGTDDQKINSIIAIYARRKQKALSKFKEFLIEMANEVL